MLHWFLGPRLLDPGAGRERGVTTHTRITDQLEVSDNNYDDDDELISGIVMHTADMAQICLLLCERTDDGSEF